MFDYVIVGSGLFGSVFAYEMTKIGKKCLVLEKRNHIAGNCFTENKDNINFHTYGPHIFHTNDKGIWDWINRFTEFLPYKHSPKVNFKGKIYSFPINLSTLNQMFGVNTPKEAKDKLDSLKLDIEDPKNLEDWILSQVGTEIYETFIKGYTEKHWNKPATKLPSSIIKRLPIRFNFNDNYYFDHYQGIPKGGYTKIFEKLLDGIEVRLNTDYFKDKDYYNSICDKVVYTGKIDEFYDFKFGRLEYRTLFFENLRLDIDDFQGCSQMNYTDKETPFTRIVEHKHFEDSKSDVTWITKEYSKDCGKNDIPYYPINDELNNFIYQKYKQKSLEESKVIFGGRLAEYKYYDMHQIIASALKKVNDEVKTFHKNINIVQ
jgi:UDP-galactopyranose mutase